MSQMAQSSNFQEEARRKLESCRPHIPFSAEIIGWIIDGGCCVKIREHGPNNCANSAATLKSVPTKCTKSKSANVSREREPPAGRRKASLRPRVSTRGTASVVGHVKRLQKNARPSAHARFCVLTVASVLHLPVSKKCAEVDRVTVISITNQVWPPADVSQMKVSLFCLVFLLFSLPF